MKTPTPVLASLVAIAALAACNDSTGPGNEGAQQVSLSFAAGTVAPAQAAPGLFGDPISDGTNTIVFTSIEVVLREIELKRQEVVDCDVEPEPDGCEAFETDPTLVTVPVDGSADPLVTIPIEPGTYDEMEFDIHKVSGDDPVDAAFILAHPQMEDRSILVTGTYNGTAFSFATDLNVEQEFDLFPPLVIDETTTSYNVTVLLGIDAWFRDGAGQLVNPDTGNKGEVNESLIKENIKVAIEAFEDDDRDGHDDHS